MGGPEVMDLSYLRSSRMLPCDYWLLFIDGSKQPISPIFDDQSVFFVVFLTLRK